MHDMAPTQLLAQLRRGVLEYCVLALLGDEPRYAFDLVRSLSDHAGMATGEGTIYPLLSRLKREGKVEASWQPSDAGPPRRYYALTPVGAAALDEFEDAWNTMRDTVDQIMSERKS
jgi:PadR family transcriptional regulator PadR